ncbi:Crp/Fnr family transcriptional regulator [Gillisia limnaea]|uniref:Crp/Fnr family transcriptional regulator n=1 Tax=Gillisia limnaea TaxID=195907 RepID=UPI001FE13141|nr:cyclic nucleotide-binding domain-containing protein [Gillisia limnaea]
MWNTLSLMFELLHKKNTEIIDISEEEFEYARTLFIPKKLKKKRILIGVGEICKYTVFVEKGLLRSFKTDDKGNESILHFALSGWWTADLYSFLTNETTTFNIEALEDSKLLLITKPFWDLLLQKFRLLNGSSGCLSKTILQANGFFY